MNLQEIADKLWLQDRRREMMHLARGAKRRGYMSEVYDFIKAAKIWSNEARKCKVSK